MYTETEEYLTGITQGYGARIQIHDRYTYPFPSDEGEYVASGFETHVALKQVWISCDYIISSRLLLFI